MDLILMGCITATVMIGGGAIAMFVGATVALLNGTWLGLLAGGLGYVVLGYALGQHVAKKMKSEP